MISIILNLFIYSVTYDWRYFWSFSSNTDIYAAGARVQLLVILICLNIFVLIFSESELRFRFILFWLYIQENSSSIIETATKTETSPKITSTSPSESVAATISASLSCYGRGVTAFSCPLNFPGVQFGEINQVFYGISTSILFLRLFSGTNGSISTWLRSGRRGNCVAELAFLLVWLLRILCSLLLLNIFLFEQSRTQIQLGYRDCYPAKFESQAFCLFVQC